MCSLVSWNTELPNRKINNRGGGWNFKVVNANECDAFFALLFFFKLVYSFRNSLLLYLFFFFFSLFSRVESFCYGCGLM